MRASMYSTASLYTDALAASISVFWFSLEQMLRGNYLSCAPP